VELLPAPSLVFSFICHEIVRFFSAFFYASRLRPKGGGTAGEIGALAIFGNASNFVHVGFEVRFVRVVASFWKCALSGATENQSVTAVVNTEREGQRRSPENDDPWGHARA
jgi:hypothetical protein